MSTNRWLSTGNYFLSYGEENRIFKTRSDFAYLLLFLLAAIAFPLVFDISNSIMFVVVNMMIVMLAVLGLNITTGFTGLINVGQAALMGCGAYFVGMMSNSVGNNHVLLIHFWPLMILGGGLVGGILGAIVGLPSLRLKHLYLAITTLSFQIIFEWIIQFLSVTNQGQTMGLSRVYAFGIKIGRKEHYLFWYYVALFVLVLLGFAVFNLFRGKFGRALIAVRDNDIAADAMGIHPGLTKVLSFAIAGFLAGVAGALKAYLDRGVGIESYTLHFSIEYLAMAIVGGLGSFTGSYWGTGVIVWLDYWVHKLAEILNEFIQLSTLSTALKPFFFGLLIMLFLIFEPRGVNNWWTILKNYTKRWPFKY